MEREIKLGEREREKVGRKRGKLREKKWKER